MRRLKLLCCNKPAHEQFDEQCLVNRLPDMLLSTWDCIINDGSTSYDIALHIVRSRASKK